VGVDGGGGNVDVAEQNLHDPGVDAGLEQPRRVTMAQRVRCDPSGDPRHTGGGLEAAAQHLLVERVGAGAIGEQPARMVVGPPKAAQCVQHRLWQRHAPLLVPLADDPKQQVGIIDRADLQGRGLTDAQAAGVHESEAGLVDGVSDVAQNCTDLSVRQDFRQPRLPGRPNPFFSKTAASCGRGYGGKGIGCRRDWS